MAIEGDVFLGICFHPNRWCSHMLFVSMLQIGELTNVDSFYHCASDFVDVYDLAGFHMICPSKREDMYRF